MPFYKPHRKSVSLLIALAASLLLPAFAGGSEEIRLRDAWTVQSSDKVSASAEDISRAGFDASAWYKTSVPKTVLAALVENGVYPDPYFGMNLRSLPGVSYPIGSLFANQEMPEDSPFAKPWWYRTEFTLPADYRGKTVWLAFRGINYRAEIWLNGRKVAGAEEVAGAFRRYEFDVTPFARPGEKNALAVKIFAPEAADLAINWVDWNPAPPDKNMGLWQDVIVSASGPVAIRHPFIQSRVLLPGSGKALLTVRADLKNASGGDITGILRAKILGAEKPIDLSRRLTLHPGQTLSVAFSSNAIRELVLDHPRLWWPSRMGEPYRHTLQVEFITDAGEVSDRRTVLFGIVQHDSRLDENGHRLFRVNGRPVLIRGAAWAPDMMLRADARRREAEFRYVKELGLNAIRLEGKLEDDDFFDLADREGILVMVGWSCCDAWEKWSAWDDGHRRIALDSLREQALRLRRHPSVFAWLNGSDTPPPADQENAYLNVLLETIWPNTVLSSAAGKSTEVSGATGVRMTGPYDYVPPNYWLLDSKAGGAFGFLSESGTGPAVPPLESLEKMLPPEKLWPINETWNFHAGGGRFKNIQIFTRALEARYGPARDAADFAWKSQAMTYEAERAMFEAYTRNKYASTGVIHWMLNNAWPSLIWHLYDYFLRPGGGYFGAKKALESLHVQFSYDDRTVAVVSDRPLALHGLKVAAKIYDLDMKKRFAREESVDVPPDGVARSFAVPEPAGISTVYFLSLRLLSPSGELLSRNFYWLSTKPDVLDWHDSTNVYTPQSAFADFTALQNLPKAKIRASFTIRGEGCESRARVVLENLGGALAFLVRLRMLKAPAGEEILPAWWEDNYFSLIPGEKREITVHFRAARSGEPSPALAVDGWNVLPVTIK